MPAECTIGSTRLVLVRGDITAQDVEAIVNAANSGLLGGGGVDGAIHRAGGPQILEECRALRRSQGACPPGGAVITGGGRLKARYVIHAVGPVWQGGGADEDEILAKTYRSCLLLAAERGIHTLAFPSISTGAYGFPADRASRVAFSTVAACTPEFPTLGEIRFIAFSEADAALYAQRFADYRSQGTP